MAGTPEFAEFVAVISADDKELQTDLKSAEKATKRSSEKMQGNLDRVSISGGRAAGGMSRFSASAAQAGQSSAVAARGVTALGAAASVTGSNALASASMVAGFAAASDELALSLSAAGASGAGLLKILGPIAIAVTAIGFALKSLNDKAKEFDTLFADRDKAKAAILDPFRQEFELLINQQLHRMGGITDEQLEARRLKPLVSSQDEFDLRMKIFGIRKRDAETAAFIAKQAERELKSEQARRRLAVRDFNRDRERQAKEDEHNRTQLAIEKERRDVAAQTTATRLAGLRDVAESLLIQAGAAAPSAFIDDPEFKRLAMLGEDMQRRTREANAIQPKAAQSGTFGLRQIQSRFAVVRGGEVIGRQQLTIQEQTKKVAVDHKQISKDIWTILDDINRRDKANTRTSSALSISGRP